MQRRTVIGSIVAVLLAPLVAFGKQLVLQPAVPVTVEDPPILLEDVGLPALSNGSLILRATGTRQQMGSLTGSYMRSLGNTGEINEVMTRPLRPSQPQDDKFCVFFAVSDIRVRPSSRNARAVATALHEHHCKADLDLAQRLLNFGILVEAVYTTYRTSCDQSGAVR